MKVLEIHPNHCWSFESENAVALRQMRAAISIADETVRDSELAQMIDGRAYHLVGDAAAFDLAEDFFDEIQVEYAPSVLKRLVLAQKLKRWLKPGGRLHIPESETTPSHDHEEYVPLVRRPTLVPA